MVQTVGINTSFGAPLVTYNVPSARMRATQSPILTAFAQNTQLRVSQADVLAAVKGRVSNPKLRAWTYDMDGHQFYVLRLGDSVTLIYDLSTGQWHWWCNSPDNFWRTNIGFNWSSAGGIPNKYGSDVIVGDDQFGILWVLNPEQGYDESTDPVLRAANVKIPFERIATAQMTASGRDTIPIYKTYLTGSIGNPAYTTAKVSLSYSDDVGATFIKADEPLVLSQSDYSQQLGWLSLGIVTSPGRLFQIIDDGALARIDSLDIDNGPATSQR